MKTILITGANRGIGLELAKLYAHLEWKVIATCRDLSTANELKSLQEKHDNHFTILPLDVGNMKSINSLGTKLKGQPIDILMNNAGIIGSKTESIGNLDFDTWLETFKVNTVAPGIIAQTFVENVAASELKLIVNMSSSLGSISNNTSNGYTYYRTSKAALNMLTKNLAVALKSKRITVVCLHPGWVKTDMGGKDAKITTLESVKGIRAVLSGLTLLDSGTFLEYDGKHITW